MLVVKIELWPFGNEDKKRTIATSKIWNKGCISLTEGYYYGYNFDDMGRLSEYSTTVPIEGSISNHDRSENVWSLVSKCIKNGFQMKKGEDKCIEL